MSTFRYHKNQFPYEKTFRWLKGLLLDFDTVFMVEYMITVITYGQYGDLVYKKWIIGYLCDKNLGKHHKLITVKPQPRDHVFFIS